MIVANHIPIGVSPIGSEMEWWMGDKNAKPGFENAVDLAGLVKTLQATPNLLMWIAGHRHFNVVKAFPSADPSRPEQGFWQVETSSLRDFPQQFRTLRDLSQQRRHGVDRSRERRRRRGRGNAGGAIAQIRHRGPADHRQRHQAQQPELRDRGRPRHAAGPEHGPDAAAKRRSRRGRSVDPVRRPEHRRKSRCRIMRRAMSNC